MPVSSLLSSVQYNGNGATTSFAVSFPFYDLNVTLIAADGTETHWTEGTQYTVLSSSGFPYGDGNTGSVEIVTSPTDYTPASGTKLRIERNTSRTQDVDFNNGSPFSQATVEGAFNILTMLLQEISAFKGLHFARQVSGADTITAEVYPAITSYTQAPMLVVVPDEDNTGAATINLNGISAVSIVASWTGATLPASTLQANVPAILVYDQTNNRYVVLSSGSSSGGSSGNKRYVAAAVGGTAQAITVTTDFTLTSLPSGSSVLFKPSSNITGPDPTVAVDSVAAMTVKSPTGASLAADEMHSGRWYELLSTGTELWIVGGYE